MSLFGKNTAFISGGVSCQANKQLGLNGRFLNRIFAEQFEQKTSIFDQVLVDIDHVAPFIDRIMSKKPFTPKSLTSDATITSKFSIEDLRLYLWHEHDIDESMEIKELICSKINLCPKTLLSLSVTIRHILYLLIAKTI